MRFAPYLVGLCLGLELFACSSTSSTTTTIVRPELIAVSPDDFLGGYACGDGPADVHSYVATLFDVTPAADGTVPNPGTALPSSLPTPCTQPVTFSSTPTLTTVIANHRYLAVVDAYTVNAADLTPAGPGSREMNSTPTWQATCGGYPPSPAPDAGADAAPESDPGSAGAAGAPNSADAAPPGVLSYAALTQTPHNCGVGLVVVNAPPASN